MLFRSNVQLINGATLTVPDPMGSSKRLYGLDLQVDGTVSVDGTSRVDVRSKGYPGSLSSGWQGPDFVSKSNPSATSPDGSNRRGCHGGIRGRSGGGFDCTYGRYEQARFAGSGGRASSNSSSANGGGRITLRAFELVLAGELRAEGGASGAGGLGAAGGGIHVEVERLSGPGVLQAIGGAAWTRGKGDRGGGGGRISVYATDRSGFSGAYRAWGGTGGSNGGAGTVYLRDAGQVPGHLRVDNGGRTSLSSGTPIRSVGRQVISAVSQVTPGVWAITVEGSPWIASDAALDWGLDGREVDLDAGETVGAHYTIDSNTADTLQVRTNDDLSAVVGNELVGVQRVASLVVTGRADVDFGQDRLVIDDVAGSRIEAGSTLRVGELDQATLEVLAGHGEGQVGVRHTPALVCHIPVHRRKARELLLCLYKCSHYLLQQYGIQGTWQLYLHE